VKNVHTANSELKFKGTESFILIVLFLSTESLLDILGIVIGWILSIELRRFFGVGHSNILPKNTEMEESSFKFASVFLNPLSFSG
jgi:hypothetical protein